MRLASPNEFRRRIELLEQWLWTDGLAVCGLETPTPALLADRVEELSDLYTLERDRLATAPLRRGHLLPRLLYFLCSDAPKVHLVLRELVERHGPERFDCSSLVDVGCGVGATAAGLSLSLDAGGGSTGDSLGTPSGTPSGVPIGQPPLRILGVDLDPAVLPVWTAVARRCAAIAGVAPIVDVQLASLADFEPDHGATLVVAQAALNECLESAAAQGRADAGLDELAQRIERWAARRPCLLIEPALRATTRPLHALRDKVLAGRSTCVLAPCPHQMDCPMLANPRDWCHEIRRWPPTPRVAEVQRLTRRRDDRLKFSFVALAARPATMDAPKDGQKDRGGFRARLVSDPLATRGKVERFACTSSGTLRRLRLLDRERTPANAILAEAGRGTMVAVEGLDAGDRVGPEVSITSVPSAVPTHARTAPPAPWPDARRSSARPAGPPADGRSTPAAPDTPPDRA